MVLRFRIPECYMFVPKRFAVGLIACKDSKYRPLKLYDARSSSCTFAALCCGGGPPAGGLPCPQKIGIDPTHLLESDGEKRIFAIAERYLSESGPGRDSAIRTDRTTLLGRTTLRFIWRENRTQLSFRAIVVVGLVDKLFYEPGNAQRSSQSGQCPYYPSALRHRQWNLLGLSRLSR